MRQFLLSSVLLGALPLASFAQQIRPLSADPHRAPRALTTPAPGRRPAALALPFFDDFARLTDPAPDPLLWAPGGGAYQNNRFGDNPPSQGVITFDGLNGFGESYATPNDFGDTDTLTSQLIDLSGRQNVVLSFWWQAGGVGGAQSAPGSTIRGTSELSLEMDGGGGWFTEWFMEGTGAATAFQQVFVTVPTSYLTGSFHFRFRATGIQAGTQDTWNVDYITLDANRQPQPGPLRDAALSRPLSSALKRYTAMPVWQFNAAANPADELNDSTTTTVTNLDLAGSTPTPLAFDASLRVLELGSPIATAPFGTGTLVLPAAQQQEILASVRSVPAGTIPNTPSYKQLEQKFTLNSGEQTPLTQWNDVLTRTTDLSTYYAFDDGSPETYLSLEPDPLGERYSAYAYDLNQPDQVAGMGIYIGSDVPTNQVMYAGVWEEDPANPGRPKDTYLKRQAFRVPSDSVLRSLGRWYYIFFDQPVPVTGRFFAGFGQPVVPSQLYITVGFDYNEKRPSRPLWSWNNINHWFQFSTFPMGTAMLRPLMNQNGLLAAPGPVAVTPAPEAWPNPVSAAAGVVRLGGDFSGVTLFDALGRPLRSAPAGARELEVRGLVPGLYVLRFAQGAAQVTRRLVVVD